MMPSPGQGLAPRQRIFGPFQRIDEEDAPGARGFGLGLAIVRRIARCHGGRVDVGEADLGGARFRLSLPADAPAGPTRRR